MDSPLFADFYHRSVPLFCRDINAIAGFSILLDAEVHRWPGMMVISIVGFGTSYGLEKFGLGNCMSDIFVDSHLV